jgi:hypothetical protein
MPEQIQSTSFSLAAVEGLCDGVEAATFSGEQRTNRAGVPIWRVVVSVREPGEIRRRSIDVMVAANESPVLTADARVVLIAPTLSVWRTPEGRSGFTVRAERVEELTPIEGGGSRLPTTPSRGQR